LLKIRPIRTLSAQAHFAGQRGMRDSEYNLSMRIRQKPEGLDSRIRNLSGYYFVISADAISGKSHCALV
jgi:hypothetical protein